MKMMSRSIRARIAYSFVVLFVTLSQFHSAHGDPVLLYRVSRTGDLEITGFDGEWIAWTNAAIIELQATVDPVSVPWQTIDQVESGALSGAMAIPQPTYPIPENAVLVGIRPQALGDTLDEGSEHERPTRVLATAPFFIDRYTVTCDFFRDVYQWAYENEMLTIASNVVFNTVGTPHPLVALDDALSTLSFANGTFTIKEGFGNLPITHVTWHGALAFGNFRSAMAGLPLAIDFSDWSCDFAAPGFRLPTEIEWERAARGTQNEHRFPWPSTADALWEDIDGTKANYWAGGDAAVSTNTHYLTPVGHFADSPNSLGLFDMAGNVYEWCWDGYRFSGFSDPDAALSGYTGPTQTMTRVVRGGAWADSPDLLRIAHRSAAVPQAAQPMIGFRCVRNF